MVLRRKQKSRAQQVMDLAVTYLKLRAAGKVAKGAGKGAKKAAKGTAVYKVAKKTPVVRRLPFIAAGAGVATVAAVKVIRARSSHTAAAA